jgi:hypothetical protein
MPRAIKDQLVGLDPHFRYRGLSQTRIETFSDAVFALAITLVVLSSSVPETFADLKRSMTDVLPFFLCVVLLVVIWKQHYTFFLRYGLQDTRTIVLNTFLLFLVMVYVYPLKFLMRFLVSFYGGIITGDMGYMRTQYFDSMSDNDMGFLMVIYGLGASFIFFTLFLLYRRAGKLGDDLGLSEYEVFQTRVSARANFLLGIIPFLSFFIALVGPDHWITYMLSGFSYMLYPVVMPLFGRRVTKQQKKLFPKLSVK